MYVTKLSPPSKKLRTTEPFTKQDKGENVMIEETSMVEIEAREHNLEKEVDLLVREEVRHCFNQVGDTFQESSGVLSLDEFQTFHKIFDGIQREVGRESEFKFLEKASIN